MKKPLLLLTLIAVAALAAWQLVPRRPAPGLAYRFVEIERGDLEAAVTATGSLEAVTTVTVGTQVSGQIAEIFADFNDRARKGQLIARIDPTLLQQEVRAAEAALERRQAEEAQRRWEHERARRLHADGVVQDSEYQTAMHNHAVAEAELKAARVNVERARRNLGYTEIRAPINGVVVERNVDVGQTVAASLSAPTLFRIAETLSRMRILVAVDESDIGRIERGQSVRFTVQAYPDLPFIGTVEQVRLQSKMQDNVVSYTVVVGVGNAEGKLLPGMTATTFFLLDTARDVLKVANAALRLRPTEEMWGEVRRRSGGAQAAPPAEARPGGGSPSAAAPRLWCVGEDGRLDALPVRTGITNGQETEIEGEGLHEGMRVIAGISRATDLPSSSPFDGRAPGGHTRPPGI